MRGGFQLKKGPGRALFVREGLQLKQAEPRRVLYVREGFQLNRTEPGRVPWSREVLLQSAVHRKIAPRWLPLRFVGATGSEPVAVSIESNATEPTMSTLNGCS